ncbi:ABC transporter permease [Amycolatopsis rubida]|uniref:NitT/TauT family transport system permease protein/sulfonate transport system permease protein n=1 Tax=Amycolatopsis rubida TaxID=112413 RepID=A0A1I5V5A4_9PSEU|nr:ABC transporter permease subunit [Amycolatopsis rubida]SFQ02733.1 NitT/TauT family transport system permease protein/sulfonate transport system permease protein [Amycolatopsis rubida]
MVSSPRTPAVLDRERTPATPPAEPARRRATRPRVLVWTFRLAILAVALGGWQWYGATSGGVFVPSMTQTLAQLPELASSGVLAPALWSSNTSLLVGYPLSAVFGLAIGFLVGRRRTADRALSYWLDVAMVVPIIATVPVVIVALGLTFTARVAVVVLFALPVIAMNARAAVRVLDPHLIEMARGFGATNRQLWTGVILPAAAPHLFTALRIGLGRAISGMVVVELTLVPVGLGGLLLDYKSSFAGPSLYAVTLVIIAEGVLLVSLSQAGERWLIRRMRGERR